MVNGKACKSKYFVVPLNLQIFWTLLIASFSFNSVFAAQFGQDFPIVSVILFCDKLSMWVVS